MSRRDELKELAAQARSRTAAPTAPSPTPQPAALPSVPAALESAPAAADAAASPRRRQSAVGTAKITMSVPPDVAQALRDWTRTTGRTLGDGILTALIDQLPHIRARCDDETQRIQLGLAPLAMTRTGERTPLTVRLPKAGLAELDQAAASLALNRSDLTAALITQQQNTARA